MGGTVTSLNFFAIRGRSSPRKRPVLAPDAGTQRPPSVGTVVNLPAILDQVEEKLVQELQRPVGGLVDLVLVRGERVVLRMTEARSTA